LPKESFFDLRDFLVFSELEMSCKELPADDVEECIRYLKLNAPNLDPTKAEDREKISHEVSKFFADPSRKYKKELLRLKSEIEKRDEKIMKLEDEQKRHVKISEKKKTSLRTLPACIVFLIIESIMIYISNKYGEGSNILQRVNDFWFLPSIGFGLSLFLSRFIIGKKYINKLWWPFKKILKIE